MAEATTNLPAETSPAVLLGAAPEETSEPNVINPALFKIQRPQFQSRQNKNSLKGYSNILKKEMWPWSLET